MKTPQERTQQAVEMTKKETRGRKKKYFTAEEERIGKNKANRMILSKKNALVIHYQKLENKEENEKIKKEVSSHFRPLLEKFVNKYKKRLAMSK